MVSLLDTLLNKLGSQLQIIKILENSSTKSSSPKCRLPNLNAVSQTIDLTPKVTHLDDSTCAFSRKLTKIDPLHLELTLTCIA